jgi:rubrerythrin
MVEHVVVIFLILGAGYFVVKPLIIPRQSDDDSSLKGDDRLKQLTLKKDRAYSTIKELEFDANMGKISKEDVQILKRQYMLEAVDSLKEIDELETVKTKRTGLKEKNIEKKTSTLRQNKSAKKSQVFCVECGTRAASRARFCPSCGAKLAKP